MSLTAEQQDNFEDIEKQFAVKAVQHMTTYWSILEKVPGSKLRLTKIDDEIYEHFKKEFPDYDPKATINEDEMKSKAGKERWRNFINQYEKKVDDYNFGTLLRSNPAFEYGQDETIFGTIYHLPPSIVAVRMQFYALEILSFLYWVIYLCDWAEIVKVSMTGSTRKLKVRRPLES
ncbi:DUF757-domain-containing protein [Aureobasidium sp. EXF-10728]|nr:DUF757-domain-containing protein [Aureobasidium sp. EXF-10728]